MRYVRILIVSFAVMIGFLTLNGCGKADREVEQLILQGREMYANKDFDGAAKLFLEAVKIDEWNDEAYRDLAISYYSMNDYSRAEEYFVKSLNTKTGTVNKLDYDTNYYLASTYVQLGKYDKAIEVYDAMLTNKPKEWDCFYGKAVAYLKLGRIDEADECFAKVTAADPKNMDLCIDVYFEMLSAGYKEHADTYLQSKLDNPSYALPNYDKGRICYYLEDYSHAREYLELVTEKDDSDCVLMLGKTYEAIEDYSHAATIYNSYIMSKGNNAGIYNQLGVCRAKMGEYEDALSAFSSGLKLEDATWNRQLLYNEAVTYEYMLDFKTAKEKVNAYLKKYPKDENALREIEFLKTR